MTKIKFQSLTRKDCTVGLADVAVPVTFDSEGNCEIEFATEEAVTQFLKDYSDIQAIENAFVPFVEPEVPVIDTTVKSAEVVVETVVAVTEPEPLEQTVLEPQTEQNDIGKADGEENDIGADEDISSPIDQMNMKELLVTIRDSGFPESEYEGLKKKELQQYLKDKLKVTAA